MGRLQRHKLVERLEALTLSTRRTFELLSAKLTDRERDIVAEALDSADKARDSTLEDIQPALERLQSAAELLGRAMLRG